MITYIVGSQRSGTTVFRQLLCSAGAFDADEVLHGQLNRGDRFFSFVAARVTDDASMAHPAFLRALFVEFVNALTLRERGRRVVIDLKYGDLPLLDGRHSFSYERPILVDVLEELDFPVVHVARRNVLRMYISLMLAESTGNWGGISPHGSEERPQIRIETTGLASRLHRLILQRDTVASWLCRLPGYNEVYYEDMFDNAGHFTKSTVQLAEGLMEQPLESRPRIPKQNPGPLERVLTNAEEVRRELHESQFEWMLDAD